MSKPHIDPDLAVGLNFDADDLVANRAGKMSNEQERRLRDVMTKTAAPLVITVPALCLWMSLGMTLLNQSGIQRQTGNQPILMIGIGFLTLVPLIFTILVINRLRLLISDSNKMVVESLSGKVFLDPNPRRYSLVIEGINFQLSRDAFIRFKSHEYYTVYYTPNSRVVLSAEPYQP
jgi:hypothetical protein